MLRVDPVIRAWAPCESPVALHCAAAARHRYWLRPRLHVQPQSPPAPRVDAADARQDCRFPVRGSTLGLVGGDGVCNAKQLHAPGPACAHEPARRWPATNAPFYVSATLRYRDPTDADHDSRHGELTVRVFHDGLNRDQLSIISKRVVVAEAQQPEPKEAQQAELGHGPVVYYVSGLRVAVRFIGLTACGPASAFSAAAAITSSGDLSPQAIARQHDLQRGSCKLRIQARTTSI